jgi:hypothetical protein
MMMHGLANFNFRHLVNKLLNIHASSYSSNKSTNGMQQFFRLIACRLDTYLHASGILMPIVRSSTLAVAASGFTVGTW